MQETKELEQKIALSLIKGINSEFIREMQERGVSVEDFFGYDRRELQRMMNLPPTAGFSMTEKDAALIEARKEAEFVKRHHIQVLFLTDSDYPTRLFHVHDAPVVLYKLGEADLDASHIISVVGTRKATPYGADFCRKFISDLSEYLPDLTVVSGLAYGIDACAHKESLSSGLPTVAVVAHGLNTIYPAAHRSLAQDIIRKGGALVSEYRFGEKPYRQRFLQRNRIVAGISDATIVVESDIKGGAMSTANTAFSYSREVMALPGRISDQMSAGCNHLIRKEKARLLTSAADLLEIMEWQPANLQIDLRQRNLFPELEGKAKQIYDLLRFNNGEPLQADRIHQLSGIGMAELTSLLGELEFDGIIIRYPGNRFSLA